MYKRRSIKEIRSHWVCPVQTFFGQRMMRSFRCVRPHLLVLKIIDFSKFMVCLHGQGRREVEPVRTFFGQDGKGFFKCVRSHFFELKL